jgi:uncharacterized membrane protein
MKRKNRIRGSLVCLFLVFVSMILMINSNLQEIALLLVMFSGGYMLRETLEERKEE